jgi:capsular polysaccharide biosynthesis protein
VAATKQSKKVVQQLRKMGPAYDFLLRARRWIVNTCLECLRRVSPSNPRFGPARGSFSAYGQLREDHSPGRVIFESQPVIPAGPASLRTKAAMNQQGFQPWPFFWCTWEQTRLVGRTLVAMDKDKRICLEGAYGQHCLGDDPAYRTLLLPPATRLEGDWTSLVSKWTFSANFYHWFLDGLPRLAALDELPEDTRILVPGTIGGYARETLRWLGLEGRYRLASEDHLLVEHFYFASPTAMTGCDNPYAVGFLRNAFLGRADKTFVSPKRFYVQRVNKGRGACNEAEVIAFFRDRGWGIVDPEALTLAQQIQLYSQAEQICGIHGAGLTNLLWCQPSCRVLELCAANCLNGCYEGIAQAVGINYRYLVCPADRLFRATVDLDELKRAVG